MITDKIRQFIVLPMRHRSKISSPSSYQKPQMSMVKSPEKDVFVKKTESTFFSDPDIIDAAAFATQKHSGQYRKHPQKNIPYALHCINVGRKLHDTGFSKDTVIAGILHDTVEDTGTTYEELEKRFGSNVSNLVKEVSHKNKSADWDEKQQSYMEHIKNASRDAQAISAFDKIDNMNSSIDCLKEGFNIYNSMKGTPQKQIEKWSNLEEVYDNSDLPQSIKEEYSDTLDTLFFLTKEFGLLD